jgi:hypothetical protein
MTAVDQAGNKLARYRFTGSWKSVEIVVHPGQRLTDELTLAIAALAPASATTLDKTAAEDEPGCRFAAHQRTQAHRHAL